MSCLPAFDGFHFWHHADRCLCTIIVMGYVVHSGLSVPKYFNREPKPPIHCDPSVCFYSVPGVISCVHLFNSWFVSWCIVSIVCVFLHFFVFYFISFHLFTFYEVFIFLFFYFFRWVVTSCWCLAISCRRLRTRSASVATSKGSSTSDGRPFGTSLSSSKKCSRTNPPGTAAAVARKNERTNGVCTKAKHSVDNQTPAAVHSQTLVAFYILYSCVHEKHKLGRYILKFGVTIIFLSSMWRRPFMKGTGMYLPQTSVEDRSISLFTILN